MGTIVSYLKGTPEAIAMDRKVVKEDIPQVAKGPQVNDNVSGSSDLEPPFSVYEKMTGKPYSAKFFDFENWDVLDSDVNNTVGKIGDIENWIKGRIEGRKMEDTINSFDEIVNSYFDHLNISKNVRNMDKVDRLHKYIKLLSKQEKLDKQREDLLGIS